MPTVIQAERKPVARVVLVGLASCFGCQINFTNVESHLLEVLGQIDVRYWQLTSSDPMPEEFDVAIVEGAATTEEALETLRVVRSKARTVIAIGACATTAGIPGMASEAYLSRAGVRRERPRGVRPHAAAAPGERRHRRRLRGALLPGRSLRPDRHPPARAVRLEQGAAVVDDVRRVQAQRARLLLWSRHHVPRPCDALGLWGEVP